MLTTYQVSNSLSLVEWRMAICQVLPQLGLRTNSNRSVVEILMTRNCTHLCTHSRTKVSPAAANSNPKTSIKATATATSLESKINSSPSSNSNSITKTAKISLQATPSHNLVQPTLVNSSKEQTPRISTNKHLSRTNSNSSSSSRTPHQLSKSSSSSISLEIRGAAEPITTIRSLCQTSVNDPLSLRPS